MRVNIFRLAEMQLRREGKLGSRNAGKLLIDRAVKIRQWLDYSNRNTNARNSRRV